MQRLVLLACLTAGCQSAPTEQAALAPSNQATRAMDLGNFSVSLAVKDLAASRAFYENLGFTQVGGEAAQNWLILQNGTTTIGLFQGLFEGNILTFNPGWNHASERLDSFTDIRELQRQLQSKGVSFLTQADESSTGPASFMITDPDGNNILVDQHVDK